MKDLFKKIICIIFIILFISITPISNYFSVNNNVYASAMVADSILETEAFKHVLIATLISAGLVLSSEDSIDYVTNQAKEYFWDHETNWMPDPNEPNRPTLLDWIQAMMIGSFMFNAVDKTNKVLYAINNAFWEFVKGFVDDNYDEGENSENVEIIKENNEFLYYGGEKKFKIYLYRSLEIREYIINFKGPYYSSENSVLYKMFDKNGEEIRRSGSNVYIFDKFNPHKIIITNNSGLDIYQTRDTGYVPMYTYGYPYIPYNIVESYPEENENSTVYGIPGVVDNPNYNWNNNKTGTKVIPLPIEVDPNGVPIETETYNDEDEDEQKVFPPNIDYDYWVGKTPDDIKSLDPGNIPQVNPDNLPDVPADPQTIPEKILYYVSQIYQNIVGIRKDTATIEEGMPEAEPEPSTEGGNIGDGIDTDIPTNFDWGDFKHFFDIFFIFIYFIVILILILLKFFSVVFTSLPGIPANTDLFAQYPTILEGVNYVKNLKVGGMSITVHQAFEYVFYIFFYIFVIKQIRKLYNAHVFEQAAEDKRAIKDMKMDYYEKGNNKYKDEDYENIKFTGWGD